MELMQVNPLQLLEETKAGYLYLLQKKEEEKERARLLAARRAEQQKVETKAVAEREAQLQQWRDLGYTAEVSEEKSPVAFLKEKAEAQARAELKGLKAPKLKPSEARAKLAEEKEAEEKEASAYTRRGLPKPKGYSSLSNEEKQVRSNRKKAAKAVKRAAKTRSQERVAREAKRERPKSQINWAKVAQARGEKEAAKLQQQINSAEGVKKAEAKQAKAEKTVKKAETKQTKTEKAVKKAAAAFGETARSKVALFIPTLLLGKKLEVLVNSLEKEELNQLYKGMKPNTNKRKANSEKGKNNKSQRKAGANGKARAQRKGSKKGASRKKN